MEGIGILKKEMATKEEMEWYKAFNLGPGLDFKETPCTPLFRDLYECQENAVLPLRDCMLFKEDFLECVHKTKQKAKIMMLEAEIARMDAKKAIAEATKREPILPHLKSANN